MNTTLGNCRSRYATWCWAIALLMSAFVAGCGGGGDGGGAGGGSGTLGVSLTDAPACGFDAVNVTVTRVRVHQSGTASESGGGWSDITLDPARKINLLDLTNGVLEYLGETALPAGQYTQVRLLLAPNNASSPVSNSVVLSSNPGEIALRTPSAVQTGIKLVHGFNVVAGQRTDLVLDFDACKSVVTLGNGGFLLKPVIKVIPTERNGINGFVDLNLVGSNVLVSAQMNGTVVRATSPDTLTGAFSLARLAPGTYDVVITADGRATAVIGSVPVDSTTSVVEISGQAAPIDLPLSAATRNISGNATLDPASATEEPVFVSAKQNFGGGLSVIVKSQAANLDSGDYTLTLPTDAPLLGQYLIGGTPPIPLVEQPGLAGQYAVEASADGYLTQSFDKNISAVDEIQDFVLTP